MSVQRNIKKSGLVNQGVTIKPSSRNLVPLSELASLMALIYPGSSENSVFNRGFRHNAKQSHQGYILLPVIIAISLVAVLAFWVNRETSMALFSSSQEQKAKQAAYVAEAGIEHGKWLLYQDNTCDSILQKNIALGEHSYSIALSAGSPSTVVATSSTAYETSRTSSTSQVNYGPALTYTINASIDTFLDSTQPTTNFFTDPEMFVEYSIVLGRHSITQFNITPLQNKPLRIETAQVKLYLKQPTVGVIATVDIHQLLNLNWKTNEMDWLEYKNNNAWNTPGGDYTSTIEASTSVNGNITGWYFWNMLDTVNAWVFQGAANNGLLVRSSEIMAAPFLFYTQNGSSSYQPKLEVTYRCECGKTCF